VQQLETRVVTRFEAHEKKMFDLERSAAEALTNLRGQIAGMGAQLTSALERAGSTEAIDAAVQRLEAHVDQSLAAAVPRIDGMEEHLGGAIDRVTKLEQGLDALRQDTAVLHQDVVGDLKEFEQKLKSQASAIESVRTAMAQTDDLVERVVEGLELLQSSVIERGEERAAIAS
jgi:DNA repair exonuclease SbcCD ATPase subunit